MAPRAEHRQNHPVDSRAEAGAVAAGVVPAIDLGKPGELWRIVWAAVLRFFLSAET